MMKLDVENRNFPSLNKPVGNSIQFTQAQLCWASITMGRSSKTAVKAHAGHWAYEAKFRWNMVQAAVDVSASDGSLKNSALFNELDPTEKGGINYFLGMIFVKLCADLLLDIPFLVHYGWMKQNHALSALSGKSSPDFVGLQNNSKSWHVFEAKARNDTNFEGALSYAKQQASRMFTVDGKVCELLVGSVLYREGPDKNLQFVWDDPPADEGPEIPLSANVETWKQYYASAWNLVDFYRESPRAFEDEFGFGIEIEEPLERLRANIDEGEVSFRNSFEELQASSAIRRSDMKKATRESDDWNGDGIRIINVRERRSFGGDR